MLSKKLIYSSVVTYLFFMVFQVSAMAGAAQTAAKTVAQTLPAQAGGLFAKISNISMPSADVMRKSLSSLQTTCQGAVAQHPYAAGTFAVGTLLVTVWRKYGEGIMQNYRYYFTPTKTVIENVEKAMEKRDSVYYAILRADEASEDND